MLGKEEPSFSPTSTRANSPTHPTPGGHSSSATHPNKGWNEPRQRVRESSHGHSGGEERQLEPPPAAIFSWDFTWQPGGRLPPSSPCPLCLLREGMPQVVPACCMWDTQTKRWLLPEPGPGRWMLCSSLQLFLQPGSERCEALWESSDSKNSFC